MRMLVLAGGFGTRLQPVISKVPKALAPIAGTPFLQYQLENWIRQGIKSFVFLLHYQSEMIIEFLNEQSAGILSGCKVEYIVETNPLGTGGAVLHALRTLQMEGEFLLTNADTWLGSGVAEILDAHAPAIAVVNVPNASRYGQVAIDSYNKVTCFIEKTPNHQPGWINAGLALLNSEVFQDKSESAFSIESNLYPTLAALGELNAARLQCDFIDIGIPIDYDQFCHWITNERQGKL